MRKFAFIELRVGEVDDDSNRLVEICFVLHSCCWSTVFLSANARAIGLTIREANWSGDPQVIEDRGGAPLDILDRG